jgi:hypothetical protein
MSSCSMFIIVYKQNSCNLKTSALVNLVSSNYHIINSLNPYTKPLLMQSMPYDVSYEYKET